MRDVLRGFRLAAIGLVSGMTAFEKGYAAFLAGTDIGTNPFNTDSSSFSFGRWLAGWKRADTDRRAKRC
ncbi:hypothetical protein [Pseudomonas fluorescens]|uniref:hypothetical protein n=1 Tax=Pseudomonas fluorescens TaxID=294 RepID=UPI002855EB1E|nr:hypothetical protein [Pseudomonas fluorescens]MDR6163529.1 ribosome modulation factor [Pseudomonas fluorescens]